MTSVVPSAAATTEALGRKLGAVDATQRGRLLVEALRAMESVEVARVLGCAFRSSALQDASARIVVAAWSAAHVEGAIAESFRFAWQLAAQSIDEADAIAALAPQSESPVAAVKSRHSLAERGVPLGRRRARARLAVGDELDRLLRDPDAEVVSRALENPRMTESKVIRLAATRNASTATTKAILASKFGRQADVRRAIAMNPSTDVALATPLLVQLPTVELAAIAEDQAVDQSVRDVAKQLLPRRDV